MTLREDLLLESMQTYMRARTASNRDNVGYHFLIAGRVPRNLACGLFLRY